MELILGGTFSGKSAFACAQARRAAEREPGGVLVIATALDGDPDVRRRIAEHRRRRPREWRTVEEPHRVAAAIRDGIRLPAPPAVIVVECLTMLVTNLMLRDGVVDRAPASERVAVEVEAIVRAADSRPTAVLIVSNEVGHGLFPTTSDGRLFQELAGLANQRIAAAADTVWTVTAGIPAQIKPAPIKPARIK